MLAQVTWESGNAVTVTPPEGWQQEIVTNNSGDVGQGVYWKFAGASEPSDYDLGSQSGQEGLRGHQLLR